ncbi:hypothetical protein [Marinimicrobium locisalis]|uniref:hypothetical protein n=1 Tax=Marinimicrobium locisalis TaxID=546022 RepID=UPI0032221AB1
MQCPKCQQPRTEQQTTCSQCGLVFHKYDDYLRRKENLAQPASRSELRERLIALRGSLAVPTPSMDRYLGGYLVLWGLFGVWGLSYMVLSVEELGRGFHFMHQVNLPFHEAGHVIFGFLGQFIGSLGGTLGQLAIPIICGVALLKTRQDTFGASLCLWWFGQNFLDIAPYMADARAGELPLLGGNYGKSSPYGFHDWEYLLGETGLLAYDQTLAALVQNLGRLIMLVAMLWGGYLLWRAHRDKSNR